MKKVAVIGSLNMDFVIDVKNMPQAGETILGKDVTLVPGGKGANQAYALGRLECSTEMIGAVGDDIFGKQLIQNLVNSGVNTDGIKIMKGIPSGQAFISVNEKGENSIIVIPGANQALDESWIDENMDRIKACDAVVLQLEVPLPVVSYAARVAKEQGKLVVLDPAPAIADFPEELLKFIDIMKPNETELEILAGRSLESEEEVIAAARELVEKGVKVVIVTLGAKGAMMITEEGVTSFKAQKVHAIDTTAAGDSFTAALVAVLKGDDFNTAIRFAMTVASVVVTRKGAQSSIPTLAEVK